MKNSLLVPGRKLLVPYSILEREDGAFVLAETIRLASSAVKNKKAIEKFFSTQQIKALLIYIFGNFTYLNFDMDNGLIISLDGNSKKILDEGFTDDEWLKLKSFCKL